MDIHATSCEGICRDCRSVPEGRMRFWGKPALEGIVTGQRRVLGWGRSTNDATIHEESVANRTSIGILSVSVWWSSRLTRPLPEQTQLHEQLPTNIRIGLSFITNFLKGQLDLSARIGRINIWHGTPIALQNDWHFRNFAGTAALCL